MKSTITDVARHAGVSIKTVSRVLNKEPNVTEKTRQRVVDAAEALSYTPNLSARSLAGSRSYLLAFFYDNPSAYYIANFQHGATDACREFGYHMVVEPVDTRAQSPKQVLSDLIKRLPLDGIILTPPMSENSDLIAYLDAEKKPYVLVAPRHAEPHQHIIKMDDSQAAYDLTKHLIDLGHTDIGFVLGDPSHGAAPLRHQGFVNAMRDAELTINPDWVKPGDFSFQSGVVAANALLSGPTRPTAIFASNDDMAAGVISVAGLKSMILPDDLSVCGFDDTPLATTLFPQLTTIAQPIYDMGVEAAKALIERGDPVTKTLDYRLVIRGSTARLNR